MDFNKVVELLKQKRKVFHSEDDLKLEMSLVIRELYPIYQIRLERPIDITLKNIHDKKKETIVRAPIDIVIIDSKLKKVYPIEIKYKTKKSVLDYDGETYNLAHHGANDIGRYSFIKDIYRVENFDKQKMGLKDYSVSEGFVFILTNDKGYYDNNVSNKDVLDSNFSFHDGAVLVAKYLGWNVKHAAGKKVEDHWTNTKKGYDYDLSLARNYNIKWRNYSSLKDEKGKEVDFRYCLIEVKR